MNTSFANPVLRVLTGCSCALLLVVSSAALAHGGHNSHNSGGNHDNHRLMHNSSNHGGDWGGNHGWHHNHHHHRHHKSASTGPGGLGPVHGQGSSHHPIVAHPPKVPKPVVTVGPVKPPAEPVVRDHRSGSWHDGKPHDPKCLTVVGGPFKGGCVIPNPDPRHHHPRPNPRCNKTDSSGCEVRDHRTPPPTQCYGDLC